MPFELLHERLPEFAEAETRTIAVLEYGKVSHALPPADYAALTHPPANTGLKPASVRMRFTSSRLSP